eukprot:TRINITY_DN961_c0_g1_i2.p1 TRINITY_DN961_c0_g1~~TRINITY_DN961_c0_g1_i2.p1  ORF type:complete len:188 (+),score=17.64 TRINITY_DN961_c0_g1_i2:249-812(+)
MSLQVKFFADCCCARLGKHLRMMGFDTFWLGNCSDRDVVLQAKAENRILLTVDKALPIQQAKHMEGLTFMVLTGANPPVQLNEVVSRFGLQPELKRLFSLCTSCNVRIQQMPKESVYGKVPPTIYESRKSFFSCPCCSKIFWYGEHWRKSFEYIKNKALLDIKPYIVPVETPEEPLPFEIYVRNGYC